MGSDIYEVVEVRRSTGWSAVDVHLELDRNYRLFAILADFRNDWGIRAIAGMRGFPPDATLETRTRLRWCDERDVSWVSLRELLDYPWEQPLTVRIGVGQQSDSAGGVRYWVDQSEPLGWNPGKGWDVVAITQTHREWAEPFCSRDLPALAALGPPDAVRMVFTFDG